ncbi:nucleotide-binding alpha-beta plait domain-containing protein [Tanacetum coccineum]
MKFAESGFEVVKISYLGELWVLLEFETTKAKDSFRGNVGVGSWFLVIKQAYAEFVPEGRLVWVELDGVPFKFWPGPTFKRIAAKWGELLDVDDYDESNLHSKRICILSKVCEHIHESFKIVFRGKVYWVRASEVLGWTPEFFEEEEEDELSVEDKNDGRINDLEANNGIDESDVEEVLETLFDQPDDQKDKHSEDPFGLYPLLNKENIELARKIPKSPGPDGFSFSFYRHFWPVIEKDVFEAVDYFFMYGEIPNGCNSNFIALIPKILDANMVKDFRPISLIGSLYKIIAKILANRLVGVLGDLVNEVQSAFVADRQILDGPFILDEVLQWCRRKKKHALIFKVDFEKAFDSVRWDFVDDVLNKFGFGER